MVIVNGFVVFLALLVRQLMRRDGIDEETTRRFWSAMQPHSNGRLYLNFPGHGEDEDLVRNAFGKETYARLAAVKKKYDPTNLFRLNQNIPPG